MATPALHHHLLKGQVPWDSVAGMVVVEVWEKARTQPASLRMPKQLLSSEHYDCKPNCSFSYANPGMCPKMKTVLNGINLAYLHGPSFPPSFLPSFTPSLPPFLPSSFRPSLVPPSLLPFSFPSFPSFPLLFSVLLYFLFLCPFLVKVFSVSIKYTTKMLFCNAWCINSAMVSNQGRLCCVLSIGCLFSRHHRMKGCPWISLHFTHAETTWSSVFWNLSKPCQEPETIKPVVVLFYPWMSIEK